MNVPEHYKRFCRTHFRFALVMIAVALLAGISFQESARKLTVTPEVPVGAHLEWIISLALVHGHLFVMGVLLPLAFTWMVHMSASLDMAPISPALLAWATRLYIPGVCLTALLQLVKGYWFLLGVRHGRLDFAQLNDGFLGGGHALPRVLAFGASHALLGAGLALLVIGFWRAFKRQ